MQRLRKKSSEGYRRHRTTKHDDQRQQLLLTPVVLAEIVSVTVKKLKNIKSSMLTYGTNSSTMSMNSLMKLRNFSRLKYRLMDT